MAEPAQVNLEENEPHCAVLDDAAIAVLRAQHAEAGRTVDAPVTLQGEKGEFSFLQLGLQSRDSDSGRFRLTLWHKPAIRAVKKLQNIGVTHIVTLHSSEGGEGKYVSELQHKVEECNADSVLKWIYIPLTGANLDTLRAEKTLMMVTEGIQNVEKAVMEWYDQNASEKAKRRRKTEQKEAVGCDGVRAARVGSQAGEAQSSSDDFGELGQAISYYASGVAELCDIVSEGLPDNGTDSQAGVTSHESATQPSILVHCSAGMHRTGFFAYGLMRALSGLRPQEARECLYLMRRDTGEKVGHDRIRIAEEQLVPHLLKIGF
mmetsp:Transcript_53450/g.100576  ORF Transcript_53450/g.100576 Transcript_53450/m.100576 type:complete len:319 (-) Transcript_53450:143-1099(-)